ncbi:Argininosuccinate lyase [Variovorax sp. PBS-H4]|uniref:Bug family tripartite tricarboxylate transporter substrate binding protein n=1 Tax=Variovorax sp. PBS-H4 TaxID=434008 RepID=UPI0013182DCF|nr:tripartite tricarboxylate transporter substrate binding protein [Variovorax sp. PBS-H4]VTU37411.1 Argininosuccinate lyase [Variovorax sp. PBS-H4]
MRSIPFLAAAFCAALVVTGAQAQRADYPNRPVRMVVPYAPGGGTDTAARIVALKLSQTLGQPVVVDNRPGAAGMLGTDVVAKAPGDGYTILLTNGSPIVLSPLLYSKMAYDPRRDFAAVARVSQAPMVLLVNSSVPANNLQEFVAWAKQSAQPLSYASFGAGSESHLAGAYFNKLVTLSMEHIAYKGSAPAMQGLASGQVTAMFTDPGSAKGMIKAGRVKALAAGGTRRSRSLPDVPTFAELGMPAMNDFVTWFGVFAPAAVPKPLLQKLSDAIVESVQTTDVVTKLGDMDQEPNPMPTGPTSKFLSENAATWTKIVRDIGGVKLD